MPFQSLNLARDGVAADAQPVCCLNAPAAGQLQRGADQLGFERVGQHVADGRVAGFQQAAGLAFPVLQTVHRSAGNGVIREAVLREPRAS